MGRRWRAFHTELPARAGARITLDAEESHHVCRVLRQRAGARLDVFDGRGAEWTALIETADPRAVTLRLERELGGAIESPLELVLYQGLCRHDRMEWVVQKATELGVAAIHPLNSARSEARPPGPRRLARWSRIALEACKQSGRRRLPLLRPVEDLPRPDAGKDLAVLLDPAPGSAPLGGLLAGPPRTRVLVAVGPEGGFEAEERGRWLGTGWRGASLGPRTLRAETAGLAAAAAILHRWGDLGRAPRRGGRI